ncbi:MAG: DNA polymerase III subunit beta [Patescibacteria group bacterium]
MKLEIGFQKLKDIISLVERAAGKHLSLPSLSCILIEISKNSAVFRATNLEIGVEVVATAKTEGEGRVAVPAHILSSFISQAHNPNQVVLMEVESGNLVLTLSKSKAVIKTLPPDDFPTIPEVIDGKEFTVQPTPLIKGFKSVYYSASASGVKPELSSIYMYNDADYLVFAATDSFRLAEKKIKPDKVLSVEGTLIPFRNTSDILQVLEKIGKEVTMRMSKNLISFEGEGIRVVSRVIDGTFPDYRQIIPKGFVTEAIVLKEDLLKALKISNIFSDKFSQTRIVVNPKKNIFEIQSKNNDVGENKTHVDAALSGEPVEVTFNYKYVVDCFQSIEADSVSLQFNGIGRPMVIRPVSGDQTFLYLVMPMNR